MKPLVTVLDDSLTVRMDLEELFTDAGFRTRSCATCAELRATLEDDVPDLFVLDLQLPDGDGHGVLMELRQRPATAEVPVILLTSRTTVRERLQGLAAGADEYVGKPYSRAYLVARALALVQRLDVARERPLVLVADDSLTVRQRLRQALEDVEMNVITARNGGEALTLASRERPDALIIDHHMPDVDGTAVLRRVRADRALQNSICVMLTGSDDAPTEAHSLESGADAYARKGDPLELIIARLQALLIRNGGVRRPPREAGSWLQPKKILVVGTIAGAVVAPAREEGHEVVWAETVPAARELLDHERIHCMVVGSNEPELLPFCSELKDHPLHRRIAVLALLHDESPDLALAVLRSGADDYLPASSNANVLRARVRSQLLRLHIEEENERIGRELRAREVAATEARDARALADTRATLLDQLEQKNEELHRAREQAELASSFKTRFLADMSHELRTPLNAILGFSGLIENEVAGPLNDKQRLYVQHVHQAGRHLLELMEEILDISRIESGRLRLERVVTSLESIIVVAIEHVRPLAERAALELVVEIGQLPAISLDPLRIRQVLYNLLSNAIKFTDAGGVVTLRASACDEHLQIDVHDTGIGVATDDLGRLFQPFERIECPGRTTRGTGLGLALVKRIVTLHGGQVHVESQHGMGSTFSVLLPTGAEELA